MKTRPIILIIVVILFAAPKGAYSEVSTQLEELINEAVERNPKIQAAYSGWQAERHKVKVVKGLPNPVVRYTYFGENVQTRTGPQEKKYGASQAVPFPGKLHLKARAQAKHAEMLKEKYEATKREVIKNVKFSFYDISWVDSAISVTEQEKSILVSLESVAQRKYESNRAPQSDVLKSQVELSKLIDKLFMFRQNRNSLVAKLNSILNRQSGTDLEKISVTEPEEFLYSLEELQNIAKESSQELTAAGLAVRRAQYAKSLAKMGFLPDITFGFDKIEVGGGTSSHSEDGNDVWTGTVALSIPFWFDRVFAEIDEKKARLNEAQKIRENTGNTVVYEVEDLYFKITTYNDIISLYKTALLPQTQSSYDAAKTSYETGKVDFLNWLDAERVVLQTRLAYYKSIADYQKSLAYLEQIVGRPLKEKKN
jgi:outer membrane protein, heavy metal efflux system